MKQQFGASWRLIGAAAITCGALLAGTLAGSAALAAPGATTAAASATNGFRNVGYFAQWGVYGLNYKMKDLQTSGVAAELTALNYAFGNIDNQSLTCFEANKAQGSGVNGSDGAGDAFADYGQSYTAATSIDGVADVWNAPLAG
jgi:chitinase